MAWYWWVLFIILPSGPTMASVVANDYREKCRKDGVRVSNFRARTYYMLAFFFWPAWVLYQASLAIRENPWRAIQYAFIPFWLPPLALLRLFKKIGKSLAKGNK